jgi:MEKHLA domain
VDWAGRSRSEHLLRLERGRGAEEPNHFERQRLLDSVTRNGFVTGHNGLRISRSGRRFWIQHGVVWQLMNDIGITFSRAAVFQLPARRLTFRV